MCKCPVSSANARVWRWEYDLGKQEESEGSEFVSYGAMLLVAPVRSIACKSEPIKALKRCAAWSVLVTAAILLEPGFFTPDIERASRC